MNLILSVDIGTTALKLALFDEKGHILALSTQEYTLLTPSALEVDMAVETYWQAFKDAIREVIAKARIDPKEILALGISAQGETLVVVDDAGKPLRNAIVWLDNRAQQEADILRSEFSDEQTFAITGQTSIVPTWPASKILWLKRNEPDLTSRIGKYLLIEDYIIYRLTGKLVAEGSMLCSTVYWDITTKTWWSEMLQFLGVSQNQLPAIKESGELVGPILPQVARELGLSNGTAVCTGALDQAAGAIGVGNIKPGIFSENTGAALAICATVDKPTFDPSGRMPCHYHGLPDLYMEHTFTTGGMVLRWFRDKFCQEEMAQAAAQHLDAYDILTKAAGQVAPGAEGLTMLPHLQGAMAPDANPKAKGVFYGFTLRHEKPHFIRAILESIACTVKRNIDVLEEMGIQIGEIRCLGGGSRSKLWNQIKADVTGRPVVTTQSSEAACLGAAILAGKAVGLFSSIEDACKNMVIIKDRFEPNPENSEVYARTYQRYMELYDSLLELFDNE
ncbi:MAG: FGGY-family carbohydrate kinase [Anaerolineales bacterium]|nr:FGGY-family carbohydrate kinase [Anaerolineales bacterium]